MATLLAPLGLVANEWIETVFILLSFGAVLGTTILVLYSKHMHIFLAPFNVLFSRRPNGLGPLLPMYSGTERIDFEDPDDDAIFGRGAITDFTWKGNLDLLTCTECGRCQSQCPAWNTEKPLSPKLLIMDLRDNLLAQAPYLVDKGNPTYLASPGTGQGLGAGAGRDRVVLAGACRTRTRGRSSARARTTTPSSTRTCSGRARCAARASTSARSTSSTSTTSSTCAATA